MNNDTERDCTPEREHHSSPRDNMIQQYSTTSLKQIGGMCITKLPPASAVQAMFLYEMQRETELERLFQGQMFQLARTEDKTDHHKRRLEQLENEVEHIQKQLASKDVEERLATSKVRIEAQQVKLNTYTIRLDTHTERLDQLTAQLQKLQEAQAKAPEPAAPPTPDPSLTAELTSLEEETDILFDERDALVKLLAEANERIDKLEDLVRVLTIRKNGSEGSASAGSSPVMSQTLPVQTPNGQTVAISVPKGSGLWSAPTAKENRAPVRSFVPGKPRAA